MFGARSVTTAAPTKDQVVRFYDFVIGAVRDVEQLSKLSIPEFLSIKWEARRADAKRLASQAASSSDSESASQ